MHGPASDDRHSRKWLEHPQAQKPSPQLTFQEDSAPFRALLFPTEANPKEQFGGLRPLSICLIFSQIQHILGTFGDPNNGNTFYLDILKDANFNGEKSLCWPLSVGTSIRVSTQSSVNGWNIFLYSGPKN